MRARIAAVIGAVILLILSGQPARADYTAGAKAFRAKDYAAALVAWEPLADEGHPRAQFGLGVIYEAGGDGVAPDVDKAAAWYRRAAKQGLADAQFNLGNLYRSGRGVEQDPRRAVLWYLKAAMQGMPAAQYNLALSYDSGVGAAQNHTVAAKWYRAAAKQGDIDAMLGLAALYRHGLGVEQDREAAVAWYRRIAEAGDSRGRLHLEAMADEQEPEPEPEQEQEPVFPQSPVTFGVQLAAYGSRGGALAAWEILRAAHGDLLAAYEPAIKPTELAGSGDVIYRLVVGSFAAKPEASALCARLKQRDVDCFVPRP